MWKRRLYPVFAIAALSVAALGLVTTSTVGPQPGGSYIVPNGQIITPAGTHLEVADRPLGLALSPDGNLLAAVTGSNFGPRQICLIDTRSGALAQTITIGNSFVGIAFHPNSLSLYVGGGADNNIKFFARQDDGTFRADGVVSMGGSAPSGLSLDPRGATLYVALNTRHTVAIVDVATRAVKEIPVGIYPYTTLVTRDGAKVYISNWGGRRARAGDATDDVLPVVVDAQTGIANTGTVSVLDAKSQTVIRSIDVGLHPSAMALSPDGARLYVANANSDTLSVIRTSDDTIESTINVRPFADAPLGSAPNALAVSADGTRLYVANAANNAIAVIDPGNTQNPVRGFVPTGWFPTAVALSAGGDRLFVASGYGFGSIAPARGGRSYQNRTGIISTIPVPDEATLARHTRRVRLNVRAAQLKSRRRAVPAGFDAPSPITHVFYIIKENRTYDQVFGDLPQGNGDPSLVQFGRSVTPNHHALAEQFVLLDNFYAAGDQSALGHQWCDEAYANDYVHKYGNARNDYAGTNPMAYAPSGFLWDHARRNGKTVRIYGEFDSATVVTPAAATWTDIYNDWKDRTNRISIQSKTRVASVRDLLAPRYPGFVMRISEQVRADEFLREFREFEENGNLPNLIVMLLPIDHTNGTSPGYPTPRAMVADNDLALGRIVEAISRSRYWPESAIFVTEDDAQDGLDHVDGHRTVGFVISPWARHKAVDSTLYSTVNMFRTIEQILGLQPLNQFDSTAEPMSTAFADEPDLSPYTALTNQIALTEMNPGMAGLRGLQRQLAQASMRMDFSKPDVAPEELLNRVIWHSVKGYHTPYPGEREDRRARSDR